MAPLPRHSTGPRQRCGPMRGYRYMPIYVDTICCCRVNPFQRDHCTLVHDCLAQQTQLLVPNRCPLCVLVAYSNSTVARFLSGYCLSCSLYIIRRLYTGISFLYIYIRPSGLYYDIAYKSPRPSLAQWRFQRIYRSSGLQRSGTLLDHRVLKS